MNSLYQNLLRQSGDTHALLNRAEQDWNSLLAGQIQNGLANIERSLNDYEDLSRREANIGKREKGLMRVQKFMDDLNLLRGRYQKSEARNSSRVVQSYERNELLQRSNATQPSAVAIDMGGAKAHDYLQQEHLALNRTEGALDEMLMAGKHALDNLVEQRHILKGTQRRMLDAANTLGVSRSLIQYIERRGIQDKYLFLIMAAGTLVLMWFIYHWLR